ncbi:hypothetical protein AYK26_07195 [Euryarchaeota archaeon SM23-78]|nr:MAG: hypothetical protein AYK26_07195 [Euryarchaeota archaeon SM23-78]MBW3001026.1 hypothetical protein [Candidatus Woesearchaeota archaeon]
MFLLAKRGVLIQVFILFFLLLANFISAQACSDDSDCSGTPSTPYCRLSDGVCVKCLSAGHCDDGNDCTTDTCSSNTCTHSNLADNTSCTNCQGSSCECQDGFCTCAPDCSAKECGDDGCGGSCGSCSSYINNTICYDDGTCNNGVCSFSTNTPIQSSDCCDNKFVIRNSNCVEEPVPNSSNCRKDYHCSEDCECVLNKCSFYTNETSCSSRKDCAWCPIASSCYPESEVQCTDQTVCYEDHRICNDYCRILQCSGTVDSCGCREGECNSCLDGESCENNTCVAGECIPRWFCNQWSACTPSGQKTRTCSDQNNCGSVANKPQTTMTCSYTDEANISTGVTGERGIGNDTNLSAQNMSGEGAVGVEEEVGKGFPWAITALVFVVILAAVILIIHYINKKKLAPDISKPSEPGLVIPEKQASQKPAPPEYPLSAKEKQLYTYIKDCLAKGYSDEQLCSTLLKAGWKLETINEMMRRIRSS